MRLLLFVLCLASFCSAQNQKPATEQLRAVLAAINEAVLSEYYDPSASTWWPRREHKHEHLILAAKTKQDAVDEIRRMLSELHNSHVSFYTREERALSENVLPFTFEKLKRRIFVRESLGQTNLAFGDEIISVNGKPASALEPKSLARVQGVYGNPLYGEPASVATVTVVSCRRIHKVQVRRIVQDDVPPVQVQALPSNVVLLRLLSLPGDDRGEAALREAWVRASQSHSLIIDLRDCRGGYPAASSFIFDSLLGTTRMDFKVLDREGSEVPRAKAFAQAPRFTGRTVVIIGDGTQSECELLAAGLKESKRAVLVGKRTAGAFNGFTKAFPMPEGFAALALPYTKSVSPRGRSYEGAGVTPNKVVSYTVADFGRGKDRVLQVALRVAQ